MRSCTRRLGESRVENSRRRLLKETYEHFRREIRTYQAALRHPGTPRHARWLLRAAIAYALSPIDLIPDFVPVIGHLDDVIIVPGLVALAVRSIPREVLEECRRIASRHLT
jgi:uncharacterized membrane protein YkvA (DUF1232 family)